MNVLEKRLSIIQPRNIIIYWGIIIVLAAVISISTPELLIKNYSKLDVNSNIWIGSVKGLSEYNNILYIKLTICRESEIYINGILEGYKTEYVLNSHKIDTFKYNDKQLKCKELKIFQTLVNFNKYTAQLEIIGTKTADIEIFYGNPEYVNYNIKIKGILFQVLVLSTIFFILNQKNINFSSWDALPKYIILLSISCLFFLFPYKILSVN